VARGASQGTVREHKLGLTDRLGLFLARRVAPLLSVGGIDPKSFLALLELRVMLARRRVRGQRHSPVQRASQGMNLFAALAFGGFGILCARPFESDSLALTACLAVTMAFIGLIQALDVGPLLFDPAEVEVILPAPVQPRTAFAARILHGLWGQGLVLSSVALPLMLYGAIGRGSLLFTLLIPVGIAGLAMLSLAVLSSVLLTLTRSRDAGRMQGMTVYVQVIVLAVLYTSIQVIMGRDNSLLGGQLEAGLGTYGMFFPPAWYGALLGYVDGNASGMNFGAASLGIAVPIGALFLAVRFARVGHLTAIGSGGAGSSAKRNRPRGQWLGSWARVLGLTGAERAGFETAGHLAGRENAFRQRTWPALVYPLIFGAGTLIRDREMGLEMAGLWVLMPVMYVPAMLLAARYSRDEKAVWIFQAAPLADNSSYIAGAQRMFVVTVAWIPCTLLGLIWGLCMGMEHLPRVLGTVSLAWGVGAMSVLFMTRELPFSEPVPAGARAEGMGNMFVGMVLMMASFLLSMLFSDWDALAWGCTALGMLMAAIAWRRISKR
jgi:hypothetical protein